MKQIYITKHGGPEVLEIHNAADPKPGPGEVLINVKAAGINFADILARKGLYPDAPKIPCVVGYEVAGDIEAIGSGVDKKLVGKAVLALTRFNGYTDKLTVAAKQVFEKPASIRYEEAASIPVVYLTAYQLVVVMGGLKQGESILIHNAGGGVGLAALDLAKRIGAKTYGTASSGKHVFLMKRGLDHAIEYRTNDWADVLNQLTNGKGVELIIDPFGGKSWKKSYKALHKTGRLGMFGISSITESGSSKLGLVKMMVQTPWFHPLSLMGANKAVFGVDLGKMWTENEKVKIWMLKIIQGVEEGWIRPHVDNTFSFEEVGKAHEYIENRKSIGKVVLVP